MNEIRLTGRLTRDPELRQAGQSKVCQFSLGFNTGKGERKQSNFIDCKAWNDIGSKVCEYAKGNEISVRGFLTQETWEDKNGGGKRSKIVIVVMAIKDDGEDEADAPPPERKQARKPDPGAYVPQVPPMDDLQIPF